MVYLEGDGFPGERFLHTLSRLPTVEEAKAMYAHIAYTVVVDDKPHTVLVHNTLSSADNMIDRARKPT